LIDVGFNTIITSGHLNISGKVVKNKSTRLLKNAKVNDTYISVKDGTIFKVGDTIVITTSSFDYNHHDEKIITHIMIYD
jgi:hypothetical protein